MFASSFPATRMRRLRKSQTFRDMLCETHLNLDQFIYPLFVKEGIEASLPIKSMPNLYQWSLSELPEEIRALQALGVRSVLLFGIPANKDSVGSSGFDPNGIVAQAIRMVKDVAPDMMVVSDICCCEYTDHGHCGVMGEHRCMADVDNDKTLELLAKQAIVHAIAGVDMIAPSGMIDGQVGCLRRALDAGGFQDLPIMSYSAKYASSFYGPFREAAEGAPQFGDRKTYQMNPANRQEAVRETALDIQEGADLIMVKPAQAYLDVILELKQQFPTVPLAAYQVSGEYSMIKAAAERGWIDGQKSALESLIGIKRAGADLIISYFTKELAVLLR